MNEDIADGVAKLIREGKPHEAIALITDKLISLPKKSAYTPCPRCGRNMRKDNKTGICAKCQRQLQPDSRTRKNARTNH